MRDTYDIKPGDLLVVNEVEYPIRSVAEWDVDFRTHASFLRMAKKTASTKRNPGVVGGKRGDPVTNLTNLPCTPLDPVNAEIVKRLAIDTPYELLQTFITADTVTYHLVIEDLRTSA